MDWDCKTVRSSLAERAGEAAALDEGGRRHLDECSGCRAVAQQEASLSALLARAVAPEDEALQAATLEALGGARRRRRVLAFLPVAASLFLCSLGVALLGGLPGGGVAQLLPRWTSDGWMSVAWAVQDWQVALTAASASLADLVSPVARGLALLISAAAAGGLVMAARRWRRTLAWRRER